MIYAENILLCIGIPLLIVVFFIWGNTRRFISAFLIGMLMCLFSAYISGFLFVSLGWSETDTMIFISPIVEEIMKFLPLLFYLFLLEPEDEHMLLVATGLGAGFATFENCCYILTAGAESLPYIMVRGMAVGVMHIISILVLAFSFVLVKRYKAFGFPAILGSLSLSMTFHALYNLLVSEPGPLSWIGYALPLLTTLILYKPYWNFRNQKIHE